jgi:hypothetical protein
MGKPVNLNRFRKQKARADDKARADQNATLHGLAKAERTLAKARNELSIAKLDGIKQDDDS